MYDFSIPMAIMDYIPVFFFGITMLILQWSLYASMYKGAYALLAAGTINIFFAGFLNATWKLFYAAGLCDFYLLNDMFLPSFPILWFPPHGCRAYGYGVR